jgi:uncharacterized protein
VSRIGARTRAVEVTSMQGLVEYIARTLADEPEQVQVVTDPAEPGKLRLYVAPADLGRIVGRRGRTANALRLLLRASYDADLEISATGEEPGDDDDFEDDLDDDEFEEDEPLD